MRLPPALYAMRLAVALLLAFSICTPAFAQTPVDLQLVLAVDASGSVDQRRFELQMQGYVAAFRDPRVLYAIQAGPMQVLAVTMVQWTGAPDPGTAVDLDQGCGDCTGLCCRDCGHATPALQWWHFDQWRHRLCRAAAAGEPVPGDTPRHRHFRRWLQQPR